jgi:integrase
MRLIMNVIKNRHGVYHARKKVPAELEEGVATLLGEDKTRRSWLKRSLGTKDPREANIRAKPVLMEFDQTLARARELLRERPTRATLSKAEIELMAKHHYASMLLMDEQRTRDGTAEEEALVQDIAKQLTDAGIEFEIPFPLDASRPKFGMSNYALVRRNADLVFDLSTAQAALSRGDISRVSEHLDQLLEADFQVNLDRDSVAYRELGLAVLRSHVRALEAIAARAAGRPIDTPPIPAPTGISGSLGGDTLRAAFEGWKMARRPSKRTEVEFEHAVKWFVQLHGDLSVASIKKLHARQFREALQAVPWPRKGKLLDAPLPELAQWGREHSDATKISAPTVNKMFGGVQTISLWARDNGMIPDDMPWSDPFANMRLEEDNSDREPFTVGELQTLFGSPVFTGGKRPKGGRREAAFWLPLLGLFTGARLGELAGLTVADVAPEESAGHTMLTIAADRERGKTLKTKSSSRIVPLHPELGRLGFLKYVDAVKQGSGESEWLFADISPDAAGGSKAWSKWFGRYLRELGITSSSKVFHSFRHTFKNALRHARLPEDMADALMGHAGAGTGRKYGGKDMLLNFGVDALVHALSDVKYKGLNLSHVRATHAAGDETEPTQTTISRRDKARTPRLA